MYADLCKSWQNGECETYALWGKCLWWWTLLLMFLIRNNNTCLSCEWKKSLTCSHLLANYDLTCTEWIHEQIFLVKVFSDSMTQSKRSLTCGHLLASYNLTCIKCHWINNIFGEWIQNLLDLIKNLHKYNSWNSIAYISNYYQYYSNVWSTALNQNWNLVDFRC